MKQLQTAEQEKLKNVVSSLDKNYNPKNGSLDLKEFIMRLNNRYPWDLWWRNKYSVAFGSSAYKETNHIDMLIEFIEYRHVQYLKNKKIEEQENAEDDSIGLVKTKQIKMSKKESDDAFDNLDLDQFNKK